MRAVVSSGFAAFICAVVVASDAPVLSGAGSQPACLAMYQDDRWLTDVQQTYDAFFGPSTSFGRSGKRGFYIETGAVQGTVYDSNSLFFERFLGWRGLLVEANPYSFAKLMARRPSAYRLETALCATAGTLQFNLPDKQRTADGCCGKATGRGKYKLRCTPLGGVLHAIGVGHVDFFSLDVEGAEMSVLEGFDWSSISLGVLLIEVYPRFVQQYGQFLRGKGLTQYTGLKSPTKLNQVWYNASMITPGAAARRVGTPEQVARVRQTTGGSARREERRASRPRGAG